MKTLQTLIVAGLLLCTAAVASASNKAAVFVQNRAGAEFQEKIDAFKDMTVARLTDKGFSIIDSAEVAKKFRESEPETSEVKRKIERLSEINEFLKSEKPVEKNLSGASALRISQMLGANYLIIAAISSFGQETKSLKGRNAVYGVDTDVTTHTLRLSLKVLEGVRGGTVYSDMVPVSRRERTTRNFQSVSSDIINTLLEEGAGQLADRVADNMGEIETVRVAEQKTVGFSVTSNVEGVTVEVDGVAVGSAPGSFRVLPGIHQMRISGEWLATWERTVNVFDQQVLNVTMELTNDGLKRYASLEEFKQGLKERDAAIENNKELVSGTRKLLENSHVRIEAPEKQESTIIIQ